MSDKIITALLLTFALIFFSIHFLYSQSDKVYKNVFLNGSEKGSAIADYGPQKNIPSNSIKTLKTNSYVVHYNYFGIASYYDVQSNATPNEIWQDPLNPLYVHAAVMVQPISGGTTYVNYCMSTNRGVTWDNFGNVAEAQSGFPSIDGLSDGSAIITMQSKAGGLTAERSQVFKDLGPGFGTFSRLDPGLVNGISQIWGRILATGNIANTVKWVLANSSGVTENSSTITGALLEPPGMFSSWLNYESETAEQYCLALGPNGIIGNAYISQEGSDQGDVQFRESNDNGLSWGIPVTIFDANLNKDSLGAFRGISMVYLGNSPCVTFEVAHITPYYMTAPGIYPRLPSYIYFWSPAVNNGKAKKIAGPENVPFYPNTGPEASYGGYTPLCRPAIGKSNSSSSSMLFLAMNAATSATSTDSNVYYATYFTVSRNGGAGWLTPERITPVTPLKDYRFVSMSQHNSRNYADTRWDVQMILQSHNYAGTFAPNQPPGPSDLLSMIAEVIYWSDYEAANPKADFLSLMNFPNPFNPNTTIRFEIERSSPVTLEVFNLSGQKITALIENEIISSGKKEVTFDGSGLSSGIYFYTLSAGEYKDTRRMLLIK